MFDKLKKKFLTELKMFPLLLIFDCCCLKLISFSSISGANAGKCVICISNNDEVLDELFIESIFFI